MLAASAWAAEPRPRAEPEQVGRSSERLEHVSRLLRQEIEKGKFPGAVALVARKRRIAYYESFGARDLKTREVAVEKKKGGFELVPAQREITIQDLLRHTSGFAYGSRTRNARVTEAYAREGIDARDLTNAELVERLARVPLSNQPGTAWEYSRGVSTTDDYVRFAFMASDQLGRIADTMRSPGYTFGLDFSVRKDVGLAGRSGSVGEYGWAGAGGTDFWSDPKEQLFKDLVQQAIVD